MELSNEEAKVSSLSERSKVQIITKDLKYK
jgi:hypothetical protein